MADKRISELTELSDLSPGDYIEVSEDDGAGGYYSKKYDIGSNLSTIAQTNPKALSQGIHMTAASSGSNGIQVANNADINFGTGDFTLVWIGSLSDYVEILSHIESNNNKMQLWYSFSGNFFRLQYDKRDIALSSLVLTNYNDPNSLATENEVFQLVVSVQYGNTANWYFNKKLIQTQDISAKTGAQYEWDFDGPLYIAGTQTAQTAAQTQFVAIYNYALSADQVLDLYRNGVAFADKDGSQTPVYESDFSAGVDGCTIPGGYNATLTGNIDTDADGAGIPPSDDWLKAEKTVSTNRIVINFNTALEAYSGGKKNGISFSIFVPAGSSLSTIYLQDAASNQIGDTMSPTEGLNTYEIEFESEYNGSSNLVQIVTDAGMTVGEVLYFKNVVSKKLGTTLRLEPENIQPTPGQWLDAANGHHAKMPATGATLIRPKDTFEIRWTNTWAGTHEAQYIGGFNQNILPSDNIRIDSITMTATATGGNVVIGDGSDTDRFVASVAIATYLDCTIANRNHDGTNRKMVIDPDTNFTGSITTVVRGTILD